jgi:hypothetical protein
MPRVIEAEARITGKDLTGNTFTAIEGKVNKMSAAMKNVGSSSLQMVSGVTQGMAKVDSVIGKLAKSLVAANIAHKMTSIAEGVSKTFAQFDDLVRYQRAIAGMTQAQQKPFIDQAVRGGGSTKYNDIQWIEAQNSLLGRGVNKEFVRPIVEAASQYGQAMNTDLVSAATAVEGALFSTGKHLETFSEAIQVSTHAVDFMVKLAKIGGLNNEDITQAIKYGGLSGSTAGLSDETLGAMWALMHRSNIGGAEAGVATRALAGRLVAPTKKGVEALASMGIDYNQYVHGAVMSPSSFGNFMALRFGQKLGAGMSQRVGKVFEDPEVTGNAAEFTTKVFDVVKGSFAGGKKGMKAQDSEKLTKAIRDYYKISSGGVDSEGLLRAIIAAHPTLGQVNAFAGEKQGGRLIAVMRDLALFEEKYRQLKEAPEGFAKSIADERMAGYAGAKTRAEGSYMNAETAIGRAWENEMTSFMNAVAHLEQGFAELDNESIRAATGVAGITTALVSLGTVLKTLEAFGVTIAGTLATLVSRMTALGMPLALSGDTMKTTAEPKRVTPEGWDYTFKSKGGFSFSPGTTDGGRFSYKSSTWLPSWLSGTDPESKFTPTPVRPATEAEITGHIDVNSKVDIHLDTNMFRAQVLSTVKSEISNLRSRGDLSTGTSGPVGPSMPEVGPQQQ